jgi:hypothetical protein
MFYSLFKRDYVVHSLYFIKYTFIYNYIYVSMFSFKPFENCFEIFNILKIKTTI